MDGRLVEALATRLGRTRGVCLALPYSYYLSTYHTTLTSTSVELRAERSSSAALPDYSARFPTGDEHEISTKKRHVHKRPLQRLVRRDDLAPSSCRRRIMLVDVLDHFRARGLMDSGCMEPGRRMNANGLY